VSRAPDGRAWSLRLSPLFANQAVLIEASCEAVAAERAAWTERTAGQQPADALKISARAREGEQRAASADRLKIGQAQATYN
jgi:hypothetical protein